MSNGPKPNTHLLINPTLAGKPVSLSDKTATVEMVTTEEMAVDDRGLVHGGFVFGLADHAAMLAVNDPNVVLGSADTRFTAPVKVGETVHATARVSDSRGKKRIIEVTAGVGDKDVMTGTLVAFVLDHHVLDT